MPAVFPNNIWDRTSPTRRNPNTGRAPDRFDYDTISEEVRAIQEWIIRRNKDVWNDIRVHMFSMAGASDPTLTKVFDDGFSSHGIYLWRFGHTTKDHEVFFSSQMTHSWKTGSVIYPHVHWVPSENGTGKVKWGLEYVLTDVGSQYPNNTLTMTVNEHFPADETLIKKKHYITPFAPIDMSDKKESAIILCRLFRQPTDEINDTYDNFVDLLEFDFHYLADKLGSIEQFP